MQDKDIHSMISIVEEEVRNFQITAVDDIAKAYYYGYFMRR